MATTTTDRTANDHSLGSYTLAVVDNVSRTLSNTSTGNSTDHRSWNLPFSITMATLLSISSFLSIVGNLMVITVVVRHRGMRTRTNLFLVNLAVADFCVGALAVPFAIVTLVHGRWVLGDLLCQIDGFLNIFFLVASIHTLMYISIHKYYSITRPFSNSIQLNKVLLMMAATWVWAGVMGSITVSGLNYVYYKPGTSQCGPSYPHDPRGYVHHAVTQVTCIFVPLAIMVFCYVRMFKEIREHSQRLQLNSTLEKDVVLSQQKKVAVTLFIVLACFVVCWIPYHIYASYVSYRKDKAHFSEFVNPVAYMFGYMNSAFNPIIYAFRSPSFREGYKEILCQTPTYVVTDGSTTTRRGVEKYHLQGTSLCDQDTIPEGTPHMFRRFSSVFSSPMHRSQSVPDTTFRKLSSTSVASSNTIDSRSKFLHQKSLTELMRSAAMFGKGNSIIESNGSVIIMKGGKIVSVRSENKLTPKSPLLQHGHKTLANGCSKNTHKINGNSIELTPLMHNDSDIELAPLIHDSDMELTPLEHNTTDIELAPILQNGCDSRRENGEMYENDDVFEESSKQQCGGDEIKAEMSAECNPPENVVDSVTGKHVEEEPRNCCSEKRKTISPILNIQCCDTNTKSEPNGENSCHNQTNCGIIINIDEDDRVLEVMPLTPRTKHKIARSDLSLFKDEKSGLTKISSTKSQQNMLRPFTRLPSVEHLDLPVSLSRSASDTDMKSKSAVLTHRRWTFSKIETEGSNDKSRNLNTKQFVRNSNSKLL